MAAITPPATTSPVEVLNHLKRYETEVNGLNNRMSAESNPQILAHFPQIEGMQDQISAFEHYQLPPAHQTAFNDSIKNIKSEFSRIQDKISHTQKHEAVELNNRVVRFCSSTYPSEPQEKIRKQFDEFRNEATRLQAIKPLDTLEDVQKMITNCQWVIQTGKPDRQGSTLSSTSSSTSSRESSSSPSSSSQPSSSSSTTSRTSSTATSRPSFSSSSSSVYSSFSNSFFSLESLAAESDSLFFRVETYIKSPDRWSLLNPRVDAATLEGFRKELAELEHRNVPQTMRIAMMLQQVEEQRSGTPIEEFRSDNSPFSSSSSSSNPEIETDLHRSDPFSFDSETYSLSSFSSYTQESSSVRGLSGDIPFESADDFLVSLPAADQVYYGPRNIEPKYSRAICMHFLSQTMTNNRPPDVDGLIKMGQTLRNTYEPENLTLKNEYSHSSSLGNPMRLLFEELEEARAQENIRVIGAEVGYQDSSTSPVYSFAIVIRKLSNSSSDKHYLITLFNPEGDPILTNGKTDAFAMEFSSLDTAGAFLATAFISKNIISMKSFESKMAANRGQPTTRTSPSSSSISTSTRPSSAKAMLGAALQINQIQTRLQEDNIALVDALQSLAELTTKIPVKLGDQTIMKSAGALVLYHLSMLYLSTDLRLLEEDFGIKAFTNKPGYASTADMRKRALLRTQAEILYATYIEAVKANDNQLAERAAFKIRSIAPELSKIDDADNEINFFDKPTKTRDERIKIAENAFANLKKKWKLG